MRVLIGTTSERKIKTAQKVFDEVFPDGTTLLGIKAPSGVPDTPYDKDTYIGALNRAEFCKTSEPDADMWIGIESGLVDRYGNLYEEAWCVIVTKENKIFAGYSSGLMVPQYVVQHMKELGKEHYEVMELLQKKHGTEVGDTWGNYSGKSLSREVSLAESLRNALIQIAAPDSSYYKM